MTKKKITLNELKTLVKKIIKENINENDYDSLIGYADRNINDFNINKRIYISDKYSIIVVFVDGQYESLLVNDDTEKVVKEISRARNYNNLLTMLKDTYKIDVGDIKDVDEN